MENREQQYRFLQPIQDSDRQWDRNPMVFFKAKVIQASSQLNPDRDKIFKFSGRPLPNPKFSQDNLQKLFRFGAHEDLTPTPTWGNKTKSEVDLITFFNLISQHLISQNFSTVPALLPAWLLPYQPFYLAQIRTFWCRRCVWNSSPI